MSKINILDKEVYNKIAAGEVVEKPASVVKELIENSIDAGATNISIEILDGGISKIKVIDNGCGIEKDDFPKVFLAHATSKVKSVEDLSNIGTLGFRGEALSSIASVSKVTMASKTEGDIGYQIKVTGGELGEIEPIGATNGTYMQVEDLFFNIPARKKFLRKPKLEENDITNLISRLIMANPNISFKYTADNKIIFQSFGNGLYDAIYAIYGKSIVDNIFEFEFAKGDFEFSGYLCKPTFSKPNRTYQTLIINGRYVINQTISTAIYKAYENFIMKGTFPFFVINLKIPLDKVDVNVHPNKLDVKFEDNNRIFGLVYSNILDILYNINNTKSIVSDEDNFEENVDKSKLNNLSDIGSEYKNTFNEKVVNTNSFSKNSDENDDFGKTPDSSEIKEVDLSNNIEYEINKNQTYTNTSNLKFDFQLSSPKISSEFENNIPIDLEPEENNNNIKEITQDKINFDDYDFKFIGTLFDTYILIEKNNNLLLIDQHAGHERILFDKFSKELENKQVALQSLLIPIILETNYVESNFIEENLDVLKTLGFEISIFGENSFKVETVPLLLNNINVEEFFDNILKDIDNKLIFSKNDTIRDYIAKSACKSAVKGKDKLSNNEIEYLLNQINKDGQVLLCPHGRPIVVSISEKEIEKWFKRIV